MPFIEMVRMIGHDPASGRHRVEVFVALAQVARIAEPLLGESDRAAVVDQVDVDHGEPTLEDPAVHDASNRLAGGLLDRVPEVGGLGVVELVLGEVEADAVAEAIALEVLLEHADDRGALLVGEDVEHPLGVLG